MRQVCEEDNRMKKNIFRRNKKGGFTVLEVIIVLAIIALFAAIIIPKVTRPSNNATGNVAGTAEQEAGIPQNAIWRAAPDHQGKFEVDSLPRGAMVKLLPPENVTNQEA